MSIGYLPRADLSLIVSMWDGVVTAEIAGLHVPGYRLYVAWGRPWGGPAEPADPGRSTT